MPKIIFNYKICDKASECGGIECCPNHAITFSTKEQKPVLDQSKCTFCLRCTLPDSCPVGAILFAKDEAQEKTIVNAINSDPHDDNWLWLERFGVSPSTISPQATILTPKNFDNFFASQGIKIVDIWHEDYLDCRLHSPLYDDLFKNLKNIKFYKLDAKKYPDLAKKIGGETYPSLLVFDNPKIVYSHFGHISNDEIKAINQKLLIINKKN